tara:strand:- start:1087 stop:1254 length:168 start_codon:yes stop_codon:yes gene_type:complete
MLSIELVTFKLPLEHPVTKKTSNIPIAKNNKNLDICFENLRNKINKIRIAIIYIK